MSGLPGQDSLEREVYRTLLLAPDTRASAVAEALGMPLAQVDGAVERLIELGWVRGERPGEVLDGPLSPVNPRLALRPFVEQAEQDAARGELELQALRHEVAQLTDDYSAQRDERALSQLERLDGTEAVVARLPELFEGVTSQIRSFVTMRPSYAALEAAREPDAALLARGVRLRTLCLESARPDRRFMAHLAEFRSLGAEVRMSATLPVRLLILDDDVAVVAQDPQDASRGAVVVHGRGMLAMVSTLFETQWEAAADPFDGKAVADGGATLSASERGLVRLLAQGMKDETCARHLDVSVRTIRRMVADLTERAGAGSRFELAVLAVREGWI